MFDAAAQCITDLASGPGNCSYLVKNVSENVFGRGDGCVRR